MSAIRVSAAARRWLEERGGVLALRAAIRNGCCGGRAAVPVAEARIPKDLARYRHQRVGGLEVLVAIELEGVSMTVDIDGIGPWKRLFVEAEIQPVIESRGKK